jgi:hypothetical protein
VSVRDYAANYTGRAARGASRVVGGGDVVLSAGAPGAPGQPGAPGLDGADGQDSIVMGPRAQDQNWRTGSTGYLVTDRVLQSGSNPDASGTLIAQGSGDYSTIIGAAVISLHDGANGAAMVLQPGFTIQLQNNLQVLGTLTVGGVSVGAGADGPPGLDGADGQDSIVMGPQGAQGMAGPAGAQGAPGDDGADGPIWPWVAPVPRGIICMWSGTASDVPSGWHICDGAEGTPDLRDRFLVGGTGADNGSGGTVSPAAAITGHSNHVFTQPTAHSAHVFTQPSAHTMGSIAATATAAAARGTTAPTSGVAAPAHTHAAPTIDAHAGGAVDAHSAHAGGAVDAHSAHDVHKWYRLAYVMKV